MDWIKAKNIIISTLIIVNILLRGLIFYSKGAEYNLSKKQVDAITTVLQNNNIILDTKIIENFKPRKKIILSNYNFDKKFISNIFFDTLNEDIEESLDLESKNIFFINSTKSLMISTDGFTFMANEINKNNKLDKDNSQKLCDDIIKKLGPEFSNFKLNRIFTFDEEDKIWFYYKDIYKGEIIDSNVIKFEVLNNNISNIEVTYLKPIGFDDLPPKDIVPCDEALLLINQNEYKEQIKLDYDIEDDIVIKDIELVYDFLEKHNMDSDTVYAVPIYCIYIVNKEDPIRIDAYRLELIY